MKTVNFFLSFLFLLIISVRSEQSEKPVPKNVVLKAIAVFKKEPLSKNGEGAASIIVQFAEESDVVEVHLSSSVLPWIDEKKQYKHGHLLLAAYVAGNVKSQLDRGICANDSYSGLLQVFDTYIQLKKEDAKWTIPEIDRLMDLNSKNQLKGYVENALKEEEKSRMPPK